MAELRKILISLPDSLLKEVDSIITVERMNRSEFVRQAMKLYITEKRKLEMREKMKKGYQEMAELELLLAEMSIETDNMTQFEYEQKLAESD